MNITSGMGISLIALSDEKSFLLKMGEAATLLERGRLTVDETGVQLLASTRSKVGDVSPIGEIVVTVFIAHDWKAWFVTLTGDLDVRGVRLQGAFATIDEDGFVVNGAASSTRNVELELTRQGELVMNLL